MFRLLPFSLDHSGLWCRSLLLCVAWWSCLEGDRGAASPGVCSVAGAGCHHSQQMGLSPGHSQPWEQVAENSQLATCSQGWPGWRSQTGCFIPTFSGGSHAAPQKGKQVGISMGFAFCQAVCFYLPMSQNITNNFSRWPDLLPAVLWRGTVGEWDLLARSCSTGSLYWNLLTVHSQVLAARGDVFRTKLCVVPVWILFFYSKQAIYATRQVFLFWFFFSFFSFVGTRCSLFTLWAVFWNFRTITHVFFWLWASWSFFMYNNHPSIQLPWVAAEIPRHKSWRGEIEKNVLFISLIDGPWTLHTAK